MQLRMAISISSCHMATWIQIVVSLKMTTIWRGCLRLISGFRLPHQMLSIMPPGLCSKPLWQQRTRTASTTCHSPTQRTTIYSRTIIQVWLPSTWGPGSVVRTLRRITDSTFNSSNSCHRITRHLCTPLATLTKWRNRVARSTKQTSTMWARSNITSHSGKRYTFRANLWCLRIGASKTAVIVCTITLTIELGLARKLLWSLSTTSLRKQRCQNVEESHHMASSASSRSPAKSRPRRRTNPSREGSPQSFAKPCNSLSRVATRQLKEIQLSSFQAFLRAEMKEGVHWIR